MNRLLFPALLAVTGSTFCTVYAQPPAADTSKFQQTVERQPVAHPEVAEQDDKPTADTSKPQISESDFQSGSNPSWIWGADNNTSYTLETRFKASRPTIAVLKASCDNVGTVFVNGKQVASSNEWQEAMTADVTSLLVDGENTISAKVSNQGGVAAFVLKIALKDTGGNITTVISDNSWTATASNSKEKQPVAVRASYGDGPWGRVFDNAVASDSRVPRGTFEVPAGFQVEKLFTVPKDQLGSWVCIAFDNKGRLLASDQGKLGICRITPPPVTGSGDSAPETVVERLDFSKCEFQPSGAQGMLWAFDSLYFCCNGGPGSGLYRARDTNGDDQFDECVKLKEFRGGGEHGPHSLRLSPDGKRIFVIAGNHTDPPFRAGEDQNNEDYSSRVPTNWGEDLLLPRMWDANGHARGKLAPGGWIASTDPDGKTWDIWSIGYRNPYDMAFNADGELFAYDADMEWDVGTPWYRPTRVVHATSGSEFGWRSGTGKWPEHYIDSLPALANIGPGSPVGVDFGYGPPLAADSEAARKAAATVPSGLNGYVYAPVAFPAKYQKALYICDWTFGTMYAIHMEPHLSGYTATKEEFVARTPLPLTDCAAGPDGALYFTIGGRGTQSELYRVIYAGEESTEPTTLTHSKGEPERRIRHLAESFHGREFTLNEFMQAQQNAQTERRAVSMDQMETDKTFLTALRRIAQHKAIAPMLVGFASSDKPALTLNVVTALARAAERTGLNPEQLRTGTLSSLQQTKFASLTDSEKLDYVRAASLVFIRLGEATESQRQQVLKELDGAFPSGNRNLDRELCQMLVYLDSPSVVAKTIELMNAPPQREDIDMGELLTRNAGYGRAIKAMIDNQPDKQQMWYAFCLRVAKVGWTPELRADYYRWFGKAQTWSGGNSFKKFLQNIEDEAWQITPFDHRVLVEKAGARTPYTVPELPKPVGPGREWDLAEVRALASNGLKDRNFANGQKMFAATRCIVCHRFAGDGGATGPDLTQLAGRFNLESLTEAIMDPSKVISDQYKASSVATAEGKVINGRIVSETADQISVLTDPEDSSKVVDIPKASIDEILDSKVSIMPAKLLNALNQEEVLDLLAYLLSRGNEKNAMFKRK